MVFSLFVLNQIMLLGFVPTDSVALLVPTEFHPGFTGPPSDLSYWKFLLALVGLALPSLLSFPSHIGIREAVSTLPKGPSRDLMPPGR